MPVRVLPRGCGGRGEIRDRRYGGFGVEGQALRPGQGLAQCTTCATEDTVSWAARLYLSRATMSIS